MTVMPVQDAQVARDIQRQVSQDVQRQMQQAQREIQQAQRDAQQAQREAAQAIREAQLQAARAAREGRPTVGFAQFPMEPQIPQGAVLISIAFFAMCAIIAVGVPLVRAFARRMDRRHAGAPTADAETRSRLERIEQAVDAIALEVERVSEGQRFTTRLLSEMRALPQGEGPAVPLTAARAREAR